MEFEIARQIGGIEIEIADDLEKVNFGDMGIGRISYANNRPGAIIINYVQASGKTIVAAISALLTERGLAKMIQKDYRFGLTDEQKQTIKDEINKRYEDFRARLMAGEIEIKIATVGCDYPCHVLSCDGKIKWDMWHYIMEEKYHIYQNDFGHDTGEIVTDDVIAKINEIDAVQKEKQAAEDQKEAMIKDSGKTVVHINECWECGCWRILGGRKGKLPYDVWKRAQNEMTGFRQAAAAEIEEDEILSSFSPRSTTKIPDAAIETDNFVFFVVSTEYDGC